MIEKPQKPFDSISLFSFHVSATYYRKILRKSYLFLLSYSSTIFSFKRLKLFSRPLHLGCSYPGHQWPPHCCIVRSILSPDCTWLNNTIGHRYPWNILFTVLPGYQASWTSSYLNHCFHLLVVGVLQSSIPGQKYTHSYALTPLVIVFSLKLMTLKCISLACPSSLNSSPLYLTNYSRVPLGCLMVISKFI